MTVRRFYFDDAMRILAIGFGFFAALRIGAMVVQAIWFPV